MLLNERLLEVQAAGRGEVLSWAAFRRGQFEPAKFPRGLSGPTTALTDVITEMWHACQAMDPECERVVRVPNGFLGTYFRIEFRGRRFVVVAERRMVRGGFPLNPLAAELGRNYLAVLEIRADCERVVERLYAHLTETIPVDRIRRDLWLSASAVPNAADNTTTEP